MFDFKSIEELNQAVETQALHVARAIPTVKSKGVLNLYTQGTFFDKQNEDVVQTYFYYKQFLLLLIDILPHRKVPHVSLESLSNVEILKKVLREANAKF